MVDSYRAGGPLKWKKAETSLKGEDGKYHPSYSERWTTVRTALTGKVVVRSMNEFDELIPDARPHDREQVQELFDAYSSDDCPLYLTIYPAD